MQAESLPNTAPFGDAYSASTMSRRRATKEVHWAQAGSVKVAWARSHLRVPFWDANATGTLKGASRSSNVDDVAKRWLPESSLLNLEILPCQRIV